MLLRYTAFIRYPVSSYTASKKGEYANFMSKPNSFITRVVYIQLQRGSFVIFNLIAASTRFVFLFKLKTYLLLKHDHDWIANVLGAFSLSQSWIRWEFNVFWVIMHDKPSVKTMVKLHDRWDHEFEQEKTKMLVNLSICNKKLNRASLLRI